MGNYLCYLCGQEFLFISGLEKHYSKDKCPEVTEDAKKLMMKPFVRVIFQVEYVDPRKLFNREKFQYSHKITTLDKDFQKELIDVAIKIGHSISPFSTQQKFTKVDEK